MTDFLTYELLSPETVDPIIMRITGQVRRLPMMTYESLLDDLMAERGKKVNLDEIFPKEATTFCAKPADKQGTGIEYKDCQTACDKAYGMYGPGEYNVVAYQGHWSSKETYRTELARVRVRLGLTVEIVEDK